MKHARTQGLKYEQRQGLKTAIVAVVKHAQRQDLKYARRQGLKQLDAGLECR